MTHYDPDIQPEEWEFKIVKSVTGQFEKPEVLAMLREEEAIAGWQLVEKFDKSRVRFKRPVSAQKRDAMLPPGVDAYRTQYGISEGRFVLQILAVCIAVVAVIATIAILAENGIISRFIPIPARFLIGPGDKRVHHGTQ